MILLALMLVADTTVLSCNGTPRTIRADSARYELRNIMSDGTSFVSSTHTIVIRDTAIGGSPASVFHGRWRHHRDNAEAPERIIICAHGLAPVSMDHRGARLGRRTAVFSGRRAEYQAGEGAVLHDSLPALPYPREAFYILAPILAAEGERSYVLPVYRIEGDSPAERFSWTAVRVHRAAQDGLMQVDVTGFGGTLEYFVDTARGVVVKVRLALEFGVIEEVRL